LAALSGPSYNFHPGPPSRPGRYPSVFALYDNDTRFGVTVHEMIATVDAGPIVAVHWFPIPPEASLGALEQLTFRQLVHTFRALAPHLALDPEPLARTADRWSGPKTTRAQADALAQITPAMDEVEVARRRRACGHVVTV
jgi:methionyl-tRNA formyltransferase